MKLLPKLAKLKPAEWPSRRMALAMLFSGLVLTHGYEEAEARAIRGGIAVGSSGSSGTIETWTVENNTGSPMTNIPVEVPISFSPSGGSSPMESTAAIQILDSDNTTIIPVGEWGRYSDLVGDIRGMHKMTVILPSLAAGEQRQLKVQKLASTSPATGTDISLADLTAASFSMPVVMDHANGTQYIANINTCLSASTWTNKTTASIRKRVGGHGFSTSYVFTCPLKTSGGTAAPNNFYIRGELTAFKAQRGAVSGGNPIVAIRVQYRLGCGYIQGTPGQQNHWYDLQVSCGANSQNWVGTSSAKTITMATYTDPIYGPQSMNARLVLTVFNVPSGGATTFTQDSVGMPITDGTGVAIVVEYISATSVVARIVTPFAGTTIASGWRSWGLHNQYSSETKTQEIWYSGAGVAITAKPDIWSYIGSPWNGTTGGPLSRLKSTELLLPYDSTSSGITNDLSRTTGCGTNPGACVEGYIGDWTSYMPTTGGRDDITATPGQYIRPLHKFDTNGRIKIRENSFKAAMFPMFYLDENTGKAIQFDNGTNYYVGGDNWTGTRVPMANRYITGNTVDELTGATFQVAHHPAMQDVPILLTGDYFHIDDLHHQVAMCWLANDPGYQGFQMKRQFCNASELRGNAWTYRDVAAAILFIPDAGDATLSYTRTHLTTALDYQFTAVNTPQNNGANYTMVNNTTDYATPGPRAFGSDLSNWQTGYWIFGVSLAKCRGMVTGDFAALYQWFADHIIGMATDTNVNRQWFIPIYYGRSVTDTGVRVTSWKDTYRWSAFDMLNGSAKRLVTGSGITLSGLSGTAITVAMPAGYFTAGGNDYIGCPVVDINAASVQVAPFTAGTDGYNTRAARIDVDVTSSSSSIPTNSGSILCINTGANNIYVKLSVGAGTATTSDTLVAPGASVKFNVGANTHLNKIATGGYGAMTVFGSIGANYVIGDTITITFSGITGGFTVNRAAQLTVSDTGPNGDVISATISDPGLYTALTAGSMGDYAVMDQQSTSGSGTGFTYRVWPGDQVFGGQNSLRFGVGMVTGVSGNTLTIDTTKSWRGGTIKCYPFAQTGLVSNKIQVGAPMVGDNNGPDLGQANPHLPAPYTGSNDYYDIARNSAVMLKKFGLTDAATAHTNIAALYTGNSDVIWKLAA